MYSCIAVLDYSTSNLNSGLSKGSTGHIDTFALSLFAVGSNVGEPDERRQVGGQRRVVHHRSNPKKFNVRKLLDSPSRSRGLGAVTRANKASSFR